MYETVRRDYFCAADEMTTSAVLNIIIRVSNEGITRAELARLTGFSKSTISYHVETLLEKKLIEEREGRCGGRKNAHCLYFNINYGYVLSIDVGATSLNIAVCNLAGEPLEVSLREGVDVNIGPRVILQDAINTARSLMLKKNISEKSLLGIGVGIPAPIEFNTGRPSHPPLMHGGWSNYPIRKIFEEAFQKPVFVDNDVNIMAMAEFERARRNSDGNFLFVKLGTGIGCGIYCHGEIYRGANGCAGDIGHISVEGNDDLCPCGRHGCLENLAGGAALRNQALRMAENGDSPFLADCLKKGMEIDSRMLRAGVAAQDSACKKLVYQTGCYIGEVLAKLVNFYNPSMIVLGGGLANFGDLLFNAIREKIYTSSTSLAIHDLHIEYSALGDYSGIIGAAILVRDSIFKPAEF